MALPWRARRRAPLPPQDAAEPPAPAEDSGPPVGWEPGHYYSPVPSVADRQRAMRQRRPPVAVDLRLDEQLALARELRVERPPDGRWTADNDMFGPAEAGLYRALLLHSRPRRVVEIGSGWSTALALDVADSDLPDLRLVCVEPHAERLRSRLRAHDPDRLTVLERPLQEVDTAELVRDLRPGDVFFIDSTHVAKAASDVLELFLWVLPSLPDGVLVHVHDVYWPFEYPDDWLAQGRDWNEAYFVHAFLAHNDRFRVLLFQNQLALEHPGALPAELGHGSSLWLEKVPRADRG